MLGAVTRGLARLAWLGLIRLFGLGLGLGFRLDFNWISVGFRLDSGFGWIQLDSGLA